MGEDVAGVLPVLARLVWMAGGMAGGCEALVGAGLLVTVAGLLGELERFGVPVAGLAGVAGGEQGFPCAVERVGFAIAAAAACAR